MVEHNLAKVRVAGSNPVFRSLRALDRSSLSRAFFFVCGSLIYAKKRPTPIYVGVGRFVVLVECVGSAFSSAYPTGPIVPGGRLSLFR